MPRSIKGFLRSPKTIVGEIVAIAVASALGSVFPQAGTASAAELARWRESAGAAWALIEGFSLDHVFRSEWFAALILVATASLAIVVVEQVRRVRVLWGWNPTEAQFKGAPYRAEFERPARSTSPDGQGLAKVEVRTEGRLGIIGSPLFHLGLLLVMAAAIMRALFAVEAVVDLVEGETLSPTAHAWAAQWPGVLAKPFRLDCPVTLDAVTAGYYEHGEVRDLSARLSFATGGGLQSTQIAINREVAAPGGRLFTDTNFGPAALLEWQGPGAPPVRQAVLLAPNNGGAYEGSSTGAGNIRIYARASAREVRDRPTRLDVRVLDGPALLFAGAIRPGEQVFLPKGMTLRLHGVPFWARLHGSRDPALWLVYGGFVLVLAGATLMFGLVRVDTCVKVSPLGAMELVCVSLKPQRFIPLFRERFQRLVREQGGEG
jgi:hypothetical protein